MSNILNANDPEPAFIPVSLANGRDAADVELIAALVGKRAAARLLSKRCLRGVAVASDRDLLACGLTAHKVAALRAAVSLGVRVAAPPLVGQRLGGPEDVARFFGIRLALEPVEVFCAAAVDVRNRVTAVAELARGSLSGVDVHPRDIYRALIRIGAAAVVLCHNHPSGDPEASVQDLELTARLRDVGLLVGIPLLDHVVVAGSDKWRSCLRAA